MLFSAKYFAGNVGLPDTTSRSLKDVIDHEAIHRPPRASARDRDRGLLVRRVAERSANRSANSRVHSEPGIDQRRIPEHRAFAVG